MVPELRSEMHHSAEDNFSRKRNAKRQLESQQRQLGKTVVVKVGGYRKTTVYRLEAGEIVFLKNAYKLSIATRSHILLACL